MHFGKGSILVLSVVTIMVYNSEHDCFLRLQFSLMKMVLGFIILQGCSSTASKVPHSYYIHTILSTILIPLIQAQV